MPCIDFRRLWCAKGTQSYLPHPAHLRCAGWGKYAHPMRVGDTLQHKYQQSSVPTARSIELSVPTPHEAKCRVGLMRLRAFITVYWTLIINRRTYCLSFMMIRLILRSSIVHRYNQ